MGHKTLNTSGLGNFGNKVTSGVYLSIIVASSKRAGWAVAVVVADLPVKAPFSEIRCDATCLLFAGALRACCF